MAADPDTAQSFYRQKLGDPDSRYISPTDAQDAIAQIYADLNTEIANVASGAAGITGPIGPTGPMGISSNAWRYEWKTNTASTDPDNGFIKGNNTSDTTLMTEIYVSVHDKEGQGLLLINTLTTGDSIYLYEANQLSTWNRYVLTGPVATHASVSWATLSVQFAESGPLPFTPAGNTQVIFVGPNTSSELRLLPPGGTTGQVLKKLSNADYDVGWVT